MPDKIQISATTADLLTKAGKHTWIQKRSYAICPKGKGQMETWWLLPQRCKTLGGENESDHMSVGRSEPYSDQGGEPQLDEGRSFHFKSGLGKKESRLIDWNVDILSRIIKQIVARRAALAVETSIARNKRGNGKSSIDEAATVVDETIAYDRSFLEEVQEIIALPEPKTGATNLLQLAASVELDPRVVEDLQDYCTCIAKM